MFRVIEYGCEYGHRGKRASSFDFQFLTFNFQLSTLNSQLSTLNSHF